MRVLVACEFSGRVRDAFVLKGHESISCDLLPSETPGRHLQCDIRSLSSAYLDSFDLVIAHPPCTHLAESGARWWPERQNEQAEAIKFVLWIDSISKRCAIENPIGRLSTAWRKPDQIVQPCW